jgi:hypothetical protein
MWLLIKRIKGIAQLISEGKTEEEAKNKHQSFWKHKRCF